MSIESTSTLADLTDAVARGTRGPEELLPMVYEELRRVARRQLAGLAHGNTLQPTSLVHEAYVRLIGKDLKWQGARHFFFAAARAMHDIVVEHARAKASLKRGGGRRRLDLERLVVAYETPCDEILALSDALAELEQRDPRKHQIVMLRFFGGLTSQECADAVELSTRTIEREWRYARAWLHKRLSDVDDADDADRGSDANGD
jgi:RNA polymerase sigma factor (TIGR02999 family)